MSTPGHHYKFQKDNQLFLELHWSLEPEYFLHGENTKLFWDSRELVSCFGIKISMPRPEEMFLYLCRHGARHAWRQVKWVCDIAQFLQTYPTLDWEYIVARAEQTHTTRLLLSSLYLASLLFAAPFPDDLTKQIEGDSQVRDFTTRTLKLMFLPHELMFSEERYWTGQFQLIWLQNGWFQRLNYIGSLVAQKLKPNIYDQSLVTLPRYLSFLYYFLRPVRLLSTYIRLFRKRFSARNQDRNQFPRQ